MEVDASPWGGGGVLYVQDRPVRCFTCTWAAEDFGNMDVEIGSPASQTFFEVLVLVLAVELWAEEGQSSAILGDNTGALQEALDLKGRGVHTKLAQALSIIIVSRSLSLSVGHLPSEANTAADSLSRQAEPGNRKPWPFARKAGVKIDTPLSPSTLWQWLR